MRHVLAIFLVVLSIVLSPTRADGQEVLGVKPGAAPMSAVTKAELRTWASAFWVWHDTGVCPAWALNFQFTHPEEFPENFVFFDDAYTVFGKIYQQYLQPDPRLPGYCTLDDFFASNPAIYAAFREYTISGQLKTPIGPGNTAPTHYRLARAGMNGGVADGAQVHATYLQISNNQIVSDLSISQVAASGYTGDMATIAPGTPIPTPAQPTIPECLRHFVDTSLLGDPCVQQCLYTKDIDPSWFLFIRTDPGTPGFDCDDFADALAAWLLHKLKGMYPDAEVLLLVHHYTDCNGTPAGHVVVYIKIGNFYYIIEAQTGEISGPFPIGTDPDPRTLLNPCGDPGGGIQYDPTKPVKWKLRPPNKRPDVEPAPWHENPAMRQHLIDCINQCFPGTNPNPDDYIWDPNKPGNPCTSNCGCDPTKWVSGTATD